MVTDQAAYIAFTKIFRESEELKSNYSSSQEFILKSKNILGEENPENINWDTLPEGETGIMNPDFGMVQAEHNLAVMNNGNLYVVYRTWNGSPAYAISTDDGKTFSKPQYRHYGNGARMGNPRACPKIYKTKEGKYLIWYHNNFRQKTHSGRNPAWLSGGVEKDGNIVGS